MGIPSNRWPWLVALIVLVALLALACGGEGEEGPPPTLAPGETPTVEPALPEVETDFGVTDTEIILGQHTVRTGSFAAVYAPIPPAQQAYFDYINDVEGGVCGRKIVLRVEDDQYSAATALEVARELVEQDQVLAFVGNLGTPSNTGSVDYINDPNGDGDTSDGIPDLFLSTGASKWGDYERWPWTIGLIPDYKSDGRILATYVNENFPGQTVGILYQNDDFGKDGRDGFREGIADPGLIIEEQSYEATAADISSQLANLRDADPDIIFLYSTPVFTAQAFRYMVANDWRPQPLMANVNPPAILADLVGGEEGRQVLAGTIVTLYLRDPVAEADDPAIQEHARIMREYGGPVVNFLTVYAQALAETVVETLKIACENGDMTRAGVMRAAESIQGFRPSLVLPGIEVNLSPTDHFAIQALAPAEVQPDGTARLLGEPISLE